MAQALVRTDTPATPVWVVDASAADTFAQTVFDPVRRLALVLVSVSHHRDDRPLIDPAELLRRLDGLAQVAVIADDDASWALGRRLPQLSAYGGAVRVYFPDARETDPWHQHPLIKVDPRRPSIASLRRRRVSPIRR
ncbi:hypothetical protein AB0J38_13370 [Streptomyces sp. NPDC050095]|uniref:hypothetical protein n=1 Tax=unclassified Streptomyces TaxID=2593676 RepID=UPI00343A0E89